MLMFAIFRRKEATTSNTDNHATINSVNFAYLFALGVTVLFHFPLLTFASNTFDGSFINESLALSTLFALIFVFNALFLIAITVFAFPFLKPVCVTMLVSNAIAIYFVETYNVVLDKSMMGNALSTQSSESGDLFHPYLLLYIFFYTVVPAYTVLKTKIKNDSFLRKLIAATTVLILGLGWITVNSRSWLWVDEHASEFGGLVLPWSYIVNSIRWYNEQDQRTSSPLQLLPPVEIAEPGETIVVLVIGESARANNFSLYGYAKNTNPLLSHEDIAVLPNTISCTTFTIGSLACMLSHRGSEVSSRDNIESLPSYLHRNGVKVIWRTDNWGEPALDIDEYQYARDLRAECKGEQCNYDEVLLQDIDEFYQSPGHEKLFIVLHQHGSHGPSYYENYPEDFARFTPICSSVMLHNCNDEELLNAYDNTILYTDYFIESTISSLKKTGLPSVLIYISDHGESLGEYGLYLHGTPYALAPEYQKKVPFLVWMSEEFKEVRELNTDDLFILPEHSTDNIFHSVMGALGLTSDIYVENLDVFAIDKNYK